MRWLDTPVWRSQGRAKRRAISEKTGGMRGGMWLERVAPFLCDLGILYCSRSHTIHSHKNGQWLLTPDPFVFFCSFSQRTHFSANLQMFLTQTHPWGPRPPTTPVKELHLYWFEDNGEGSDELWCQTDLAWPALPLPGSVTSIRTLKLYDSVSSSAMDSNNPYLLGLLGISCDILHGWRLAEDLDHSGYLINVN